MASRVRRLRARTRLGRDDEVDGGVPTPIAEQHGATEPCNPQDVASVGDGLERVGRLGVERHVEHAVQGFTRREWHRELEHETVELRLRQRIGSFELDRVLCRQDAEGLRQAMTDPGVRHLPFLHRLEQCRLRAWRRPVDLVDQHELREHGPGPELEARRAAGRGGVDLGAGDVGGHQVGRALDTRAAQAERGRECLGEVGLAQAGQSFDQHMALSEHGRDEMNDELVLTDDHLAEFGAQLVEAALGVGEGVVVGDCWGVHGFRPLAFIQACT